MGKIPFSRIDCSGNELSYIQETLGSGWLTTASKAKLFEEKIGSFIGVKHAIAVNSCTSALHLALDAIGIQAGDKVLVPTWTFTASVEVIRYLGADPVLLDVDYRTASLTAEIVATALEHNENIKAIIVVHFSGQAAPMLPTTEEQGILNICKKNNIKVIEDAAHAFPSKNQGQLVGSIGDITCLSFYANKTITTGEGGMLLTNNDDYAERAKVMRLHGINRDIWNRFTNNKATWEYDVIAPGFKYNMPDINAAIGLAQFERIEEFRIARQQCADYYYESLNHINSIDLPYIRESAEDHSWHLFTIIINENSSIDRNSLINKLANEGIGTSVHYKPIHRLKYYKEKYTLSVDSFPTAERIWKGCLSLPIYSSLSQNEIDFITNRLCFHLKR